MHRLGLVALLALACAPDKAAVTPLAPAAPVPVPVARAGVSGVVVSAAGPEAGAVLFLFDPADVTTGAWGRADDQGRFAFDVAPGSYQVTASSPRGTGIGLVQAPGETRVALSTDCATVTTELGGQADQVTSYFRIVYYRIEATPPEVYAAEANKGEQARVCLPIGSYYMSMPDDEFTSFSGTIVVEAPVTVPFPVYLTAELLRPPDPALTWTNPDRATFLAGFADAQVLALGEGTHGTREFLEERAAMALDLANAGELRVVMFEVGFAEMLAVNDYIQGRRDEVRTAITALKFWIWDTEEFVAFVEQLRVFNKKRRGARRVLLMGFDVQSSDAAVALVAAAPGLTADERALVGRLRGDDRAGFDGLSPEERTGLDDLLTRTSALADGAALETADANAGLAARALIHRVRALAAPTEDEQRAARDLGMGEMVEWVAAKTDGRKVVLLGHSGHFSRAPAGALKVTMGGRLASSLGADYAMIGFLAGGGTVRAWDPDWAIGVISNEVPAPAPFMVEAVVIAGTAGATPAYVDLAKAPAALRDWLALPRYAREFGAKYPGTAEWGTPLLSVLQRYDGLVVFPTGTATTPTPTGERSAADRK